MNMIERVAKAIDADRRGWALVPPEGATDENRWKTYTPIAYAAIAAMREPTNEQYEALSATGKMWRELDSRTVWQTYIDAALEEK
jgi:hypothetical protein